MQRDIALIGHARAWLFMRALEIFATNLIGAAPLHSHIGDSIKYTLQLNIPPYKGIYHPIRAMEFIKSLTHPHFMICSLRH